MSYTLQEHTQGIQNQRPKHKDSLNCHHDSVTVLLASLHLSGVPSFGESYGDSAPELLNRRYDDKELDKYFDFEESEQPDDTFAKQSIALRFAHASLEFVFSHLDAAATGASGTNSSYVAENLRGSDSVDSLELTAKRMTRVSTRNETRLEENDTGHDQWEGFHGDGHGLYVTHEPPMQ